ncbi:MAG: class I SAM-dependent RNA methyltransferase [Rhodospirillaceae bacterium]|nr:class I SAM-dependent RNA methyltransferase [Rhodospirillaceae bacterium]
MARRTRKSKRPTSGDQTRRFPSNTPTIDLTIDHIGGRGDGVGKAEITLDHRTAERPVFVPFTLPGERIIAQPATTRGGGVVAGLIELAEPSADRVEPACRHFMACGGCALQHMKQAAYLDWKHKLIVSHLNRVGLTDVPTSPLRASQSGQRRRADMVARNISGRVVLGFYERAGKRIMDIEECPVLHPDLAALLGPLRQLLTNHIAPGETVEVIANRLDNGVDLLFGLAEDPNLPAREAYAAFATTHDLSRLSTRLSETDDASPLAERRRPEIKFSGTPVAPPPGAFLQATAEAEQAMALAVSEVSKSARAAVDLFAGCGTLTFAATDHAPVHAVENDSALLAALRRGADEAELGSRVTTERRDLFRRPLDQMELVRFDLALIDPPRAGAREQFEQLAASSVPTVLAASCNPATFARDARILVDGGYRLRWVKPIDQFLWTPHVELVALFERAS